MAFLHRIKGLLPDFLYEPLDQNDQDQDWQYELEIGLEFGRELESLSGIRLCKIVVKAPSEFSDAEEKENKGTKRQQEIADQKVLTVQNIAPADDSETAPDVIAQNAGDAADQNHGEVTQNGFFAIPAKVVDSRGNEILEHSGNCGKAGKRHKDKEQGSPQPAARHVQEDLRQRDKDQRRPLPGIHIVGKACGENNEACHQRNEGIQCTNADGLAGQCLLTGHIAAKDLESSNSKAQREEGLVHSGNDYIAETDLHGSREVGHQIEADAFCSSGQEKAVNSEDNDKNQKGAHHNLGNLFKTFLYTASADSKAGNDCNSHEKQHLRGI